VPQETTTTHGTFSKAMSFFSLPFCLFGLFSDPDSLCHHSCYSY
jgi:hypothetical protein